MGGENEDEFNFNIDFFFKKTKTESMVWHVLVREIDLTGVIG